MTPPMRVSMNRVEVTRAFHGFTRMQVCAEADATDEEILATCNAANPSGTTNGWTSVVRAVVPGDDTQQPEHMPTPCGRVPERLHFLVQC